jgi:hypothetical protein
METPTKPDFDWANPFSSITYEAQELALFIENDYHLWMNRRPHFWANLDRHERRNVFDADKAVKLLTYLAVEGAKKYAEGYSDKWHDMFPPSVRVEAAKYLLCVWSEGES